MTSLLLNIKIPEIYQDELSSNPDIIDQGVRFALNCSEVTRSFSPNKTFTYDYTVYSDVLKPDFTKMISTAVTISSEQTDSPVLALNSISLFNVQFIAKLGSSDVYSMVLNDNNVIVMGNSYGHPAPGIKPCATCIDTDKSCSLYARKNSVVQFLFSLTKISGIFYLVLDKFKGTVDCNACIANLNRLKTFPVGPNDCSSTLSCRDSNSIEKLSKYIGDAKTCVEKYIDSPDMNSPNMNTCLINSGIKNASSCANCLLKNNSSCGVPLCCGAVCSNNSDCSGASGGCSACLNGKCAQPACGSSCVNDGDCSGAADGCLACVNQTCAKKSKPSCVSVCANDGECAGALDGCLACVNGKCTLNSKPSCVSICANDGECAGAADGCLACVNGKCAQKSSPACGLSCVNDKECAGALDGCLACVNQTCAKKSNPSCGFSCVNDKECAGALDGCLACVNQTCAKKSNPSCGFSCVNDGECAGASGGCDSCMDGKCQKPKRTNIFRVLIISIFLVVFVAFLLYIILKK